MTSAVGVARGTSLEMDGSPSATLGYNPRRLVHVVRAYAIDWLVTFLTLVGVAVVTLVVRPRTRMYNVADYAFQFPDQHDTVPLVPLILISLALPLACAVGAQLAMRARLPEWNAVLDMHHFVLALAQTMALTLLVTGALKVSVGRVRPSGPAREVEGDKDWNQSYPSGHTSMSFAGMTFLALYLSGKTGVFRPGGLRMGESNEMSSSRDPFRGAYAVMTLVVVLPLSLAAFVGASRLVDYAHDFADVNAGACIGVGCAFLGYLTNFPSVHDRFAQLPRPLAYAAARAETTSAKTALDV